MSVDASMSAAFDRIAGRERDVVRAFIPGAQPENDDVARDSRGAAFTLDPLSVTLPDRSYVIVRGDEGRPLYTRDGSFQLRDGVLVDRSGRAVQGAGGAHSTTTEIRIDAIDAVLGRAQDVQLESDGSLTYEREVVDPRNGARSRERIVAGRIALARFPAATALPSADAEHVRAPSNVVPHIGAPNDGAFAPLSVHRRESAHVDLNASLDALREAYLSLDALASARRAQGDVEKNAMDLLK
jgi:flagellar basal body rod protein FlgG